MLEPSRADFRQLLVVVTLMNAFLAGAATQRAKGQLFAAPARLESFESPVGVSRWTPDLVAPHPPDDQIALSTAVATHGSQSMQLTAPILNHNPMFFGWVVPTSYVTHFTQSDAAQYAAFNSALSHPRDWRLEFDVTTTPESWAHVPANWFNVTGRFDVGVGVDGTGSEYRQEYPLTSWRGAQDTSTLSIPLNEISGPTYQNPGTFDLRIGANARPWDPSTEETLLGWIDYSVDNIRLRPVFRTRDIVWNFESGLQGWSSGSGNVGVPENPPNPRIVTGLGATNVSPSSGEVTPAPTGHGMFSVQSFESSGFAWRLSNTLNADVNNDGVVDDATAKASITNLVSRMKHADSLQFDVTFHDATAPPPGLGGGPFGPANAPWLIIALGIDVDSTPVDGAASGLMQFQLNNDYGVDALGNSIQISRGDYAAALTSELTPDELSPDEPLTMTFPFEKLGGLSAALAGTTFDNSNFLRFKLAVQSATGDNPVLMVIDNIRFVSTVDLDGDFDRDGDVDADDLTIWEASGAAGDANLDGVIDGGDALVWQQQAGNDATPAVAVGAAVPEPAAAALALSAACLFSGRRKKEWRTNS